MDELATTGNDELRLEFSTDSLGMTVIEISGEIDIASVGPIRSDIEPIISDGPRRVVFDLGKLRFMDSSGLSLLLAVAERVGEVELRNAPSLIRKVIEITGVSGMFSITP
jgi:anti-sigma B factor antagonist